MNGASNGGCPLYRDPPPAADEIGSVFIANVLGRAGAAQIELSTEDEEAVVAWLGSAGAIEPHPDSGA